MGLRFRFTDIFDNSVKQKIRGPHPDTCIYPIFAPLNLSSWLISSTDATTYAHFLFNAFDIDRNGSIRFEDFVIGLSVLLRGSVTEKLNWAFNLYDINKDGYITKEVWLAYGIYVMVCVQYALQFQANDDVLYIRMFLFVFFISSFSE